MSTLELPKSSKIIIFLSIAALGIALYYTCRHGYASVWLALVAFVISGFLADLFTGLAHFGFDYVFPDETPILGPIAKEFREHHEYPTLDPSNYVENLTKGSYGSLLLSVLVCILSSIMPESPFTFIVISSLMGMSFWAFFFHQIHSYAHMGSHLSPEDFKRRVAQISRLGTKKEQKLEFEKLFASVAIPPAIRFLQRCRIILNPEAHNIHHISFETDFSSVNGWSDPIINLILRPLARRIKAKSAGTQAQSIMPGE